MLLPNRTLILFGALLRHIKRVLPSHGAHFSEKREVVEQKYPGRDQTSLICRKSTPKRFDGVFTVPKYRHCIVAIPVQ